MAAGTQTIVHWIQNMPEAMAYTMLGRCVRLEDIHIAGGFDKEGIKCNQDALDESKKLEKEKFKKETFFCEKEPFFTL